MKKEIRLINESSEILYKAKKLQIKISKDKYLSEAISKREFENRLEKLPKVLSTAILSVMNAHPYFIPVVSRFIFVKSDKIPVAAGVDRYYRFYYNPKFFEDPSSPFSTLDGAIALVIHEIQHLLRDHFDRAERLGIDLRDPIQKDLWNFATDFAINDDFEGVHRTRLEQYGALFPDKFIINEETGETIPPYKSEEWYYGLLSKIKREVEKEMKNEEGQESTKKEGDSREENGGSGKKEQKDKETMGGGEGEDEEDRSGKKKESDQEGGQGGSSEDQTQGEGSGEKEGEGEGGKGSTGGSRSKEGTEAESEQAGESSDAGETGEKGKKGGRSQGGTAGGEGEGGSQGESNPYKPYDKANTKDVVRNIIQRNNKRVSMGEIVSPDEGDAKGAPRIDEFEHNKVKKEVAGRLQEKRARGIGAGERWLEVLLEELLSVRSDCVSLKKSTSKVSKYLPKPGKVVDRRKINLPATIKSIRSGSDVIRFRTKSELGWGLVVIDTSGSISGDDIQSFVSVLISLLKRNKYLKEIVVIPADYSIYTPVIVSAQSSKDRIVKHIEAYLKGGGGTDVVPAMFAGILYAMGIKRNFIEKIKGEIEEPLEKRLSVYLEQLEEKAPSAMVKRTPPLFAILFTDGYTPWYEETSWKYITGGKRKTPVIIYSVETLPPNNIKNLPNVKVFLVKRDPSGELLVCDEDESS